MYDVVFYTAKQGDSYFSIAGSEYGDERLGIALARVNNYKGIRSGASVFIPEKEDAVRINSIGITRPRNDIVLMVTCAYCGNTKRDKYGRCIGCGHG